MQKTLEQLIDEEIESLKMLPKSDMLQAQNEYREIEPLMSFLGIECSQIKRRHGQPIDFELKYENKNIALEVTDIRPYLENYKIAKKSNRKGC